MKRQGKYKNTGNDNQDNALTTRKLSEAKGSNVYCHQSKSNTKLKPEPRPFAG